MVAALLRQALPVPLAYHRVITGRPFTAGFKIVQHLLLCGAEGQVRFSHLAHADKYDKALKKTEQFVYTDRILL